MTVLAFYGSGSGDPTRSIRRLARQSADGVPATSGFIDFYHNGSPMKLGRASVERAALTSGSTRGLPLAGKFEVGGVGPFNMGDLNANDSAQLALFKSFAQGSLSANVSGAHYLHRIGDWFRENGGGTQELDKLTVIGEDDKGYAARAVDVVPSGFSLNIASRQNVALTFNLNAGKVDFHDDPTVTGTGIVAPILRNDWAGNYSATDQDIFITIVSQTATTVTFTCRVGAAGTESASQTATFNTWTRLYYGSTDAKLGTFGSWIEAYFPQASTTYLKTGGVIAESGGGADALVNMAAATWVFAGVDKTMSSKTATLNQNDSAAAALNVGEAYKAVISLSASTSALTATKGVKAVAASAVAPATPAGEIYLATVTVLYQGGGTSIIANANIDQTAKLIYGFPATDIWAFDQRRDRWVPSFETEVVIPEINCRFLVDGVSIPMDGGITVTATRETSESRYAPGSAQPVGTYQAGFKTVNISLNRRFVDLTLEKALLNADTIAFVAEAYADTAIGATEANYGYSFVAPYCRVTGQTVSGELDEALVLECRLPPASYNYAYTTPNGSALTVESDFEVACHTGVVTIP